MLSSAVNIRQAEDGCGEMAIPPSPVQDIQTGHTKKLGSKMLPPSTLRHPNCLQIKLAFSAHDSQEKGAPQETTKREQ